MTNQVLEVLYEDNHLLVVNKPAQVPTMGVENSRVSLLELAKQYIQTKYDKPGNVYLGVVSRLDAPVTGVVLLGRTSKAASRLSAAFRNHAVEKQYWAVVSGCPEPAEGTLEHYLRKDERHRRVHTTHSSAEGAQFARLSYKVLRQRGDLSLVEVRLDTGRKHQIRVQFAKLGHPVLGDRKYGSKGDFPSGIALHSRRLALEHPVRKVPLEFIAPVPEAWSRSAGVREMLR